MKIHEVAKLTGVTVRTLHYYDHIGLLKPSEVMDTGYRVYNRESLELLQQILFFRELGFPLLEIKNIMNSPGYSRKEALLKHRELLLKKRQHLNGLIELVNDAIEGGTVMRFEEFDETEMEAMKTQYAAEVKERWGKTGAYTEYVEKTEGLKEAQWKKMMEGLGAIMQEFGEKRHLAPDSTPVQDLVKKWQDYITANYYTCTKEILSGLGKMYTGDVRFQKNIDKYGVGTAEFMANAVEIYCQK